MAGASPRHPAARPVRPLRVRLLGIPHLRGVAADRLLRAFPRPSPELLHRRHPGHHRRRLVHPQPAARHPRPARRAGQPGAQQRHRALTRSTSGGWSPARDSESRSGPRSRPEGSPTSDAARRFATSTLGRKSSRPPASSRGTIGWLWATTGERPGGWPPRIGPDVALLRRSREFRLLYGGQMSSFAGAMISFVAMPYQAYQLTRSSLVV